MHFRLAAGSILFLAAFLSDTSGAEVSVGRPDAAAWAEIARSFDVRLPDKVIRINGTITAADVDAVEAALAGMPAQREYREHREVAVVLDSPGGSFEAGIRIAGILDRYQVPTFVPAGAECLSACAVIFMAGTEQLLGGEAAEQRVREIEWPAKLGFHRPFLADMNVKVPANVLQALSPDEIGAIFGEEVLQAFDTANALIQRMLEIDPEAWNTGLLLRMLTATRGSEENAFIYLETVEDALAWGIDVINIAPPPISNRNGRFETALALCFNWGTRAESAVRRYWPDSADLDKHRRYNLDRRDPFMPTISEDGRTVTILWHLWEGHEGCVAEFLSPGVVSLKGTARELDFSGRRGGGVFDFNARMRDRLFGHSPDARLDGIALKIETDEPTGRCIVMDSRRKLDDEPCRLGKDVDYAQGYVSTYVWPSGSKTVVIGLFEEGWLVNGNPADRVDAAPDGQGKCWLNSATGRTFCYVGAE